MNTASTSGLFDNAGQTNYGATKSAIATLTIIAEMELRRYGVRLNVISPAARTRLTAGLVGQARDGDAGVGFDAEDPANISPFVAYLATEDCPITGRSFFVHGGSVHLFQPWALVDKIETDHRWTVEELREAAPRLADVPFDLGKPW